MAIRLSMFRDAKIHFIKLVTIRFPDRILLRMKNETTTSRWIDGITKMAEATSRKDQRDSAAISAKAVSDQDDSVLSWRGKVERAVLWFFLTHPIRHWTTNDVLIALGDHPASSVRGAITRLVRLGLIRRISPRRRSPYSPVRFVRKAAISLPNTI